MLDREFPSYQSLPEPLSSRFGLLNHEELHAIRLLGSEIENLLAQDCMLLQQSCLAASDSAGITLRCLSNLKSVLQYQDILRQSFQKELLNSTTKKRTAEDQTPEVILPLTAKKTTQNSPPQSTAQVRLESPDSQDQNSGMASANPPPSPASLSSLNLEDGQNEVAAEHVEQLVTAALDWLLELQQQLLEIEDCSDSIDPEPLTFSYVSAKPASLSWWWKFAGMFGSSYAINEDRSGLLAIDDPPKSAHMEEYNHQLSSVVLLLYRGENLRYSISSAGTASHTSNPESRLRCLEATLSTLLDAFRSFLEAQIDLRTVRNKLLDLVFLCRSDAQVGIQPQQTGNQFVTSLLESRLGC